MDIQLYFSTCGNHAMQHWYNRRARITFANMADVSIASLNSCKKKSITKSPVVGFGDLKLHLTLLRK